MLAPLKMTPHALSRRLRVPASRINDIVLGRRASQPTERYPANPNGSPLGITGLTTRDGRFTILMPHPERVWLRKQSSWLPDDWLYEQGPWLRLFHNARRWVGR